MRTVPCPACGRPADLLRFVDREYVVGHVNDPDLCTVTRQEATGMLDVSLGAISRG